MVTGKSVHLDPSSRFTTLADIEPWVRAIREQKAVYVMTKFEEKV